MKRAMLILVLGTVSTGLLAAVPLEQRLASGLGRGERIEIAISETDTLVPSLATVLERESEWRVRIEITAGPDASRAQRLAAGRRAIKLRENLVGLGIAPHRIETSGMVPRRSLSASIGITLLEEVD